MTAEPITHFTFSIERRLEASPQAVFDAFAKEEAKTKWFAATDDWRETRRAFDFRVGGEERLAGVWKSGTTTEFVAFYRDIVEGSRIAYVYDMHVNGEKISVSLATIEVAADGAGAVLKLTEQGAFFVGGVEAGKSREHGTNFLMDRLAASLDA